MWDVLIRTYHGSRNRGWVLCEYETRHWSLSLRMRLDIKFIPLLRVANIGNVDRCLGGQYLLRLFLIENSINFCLSEETRGFHRRAVVTSPSVSLTTLRRHDFLKNSCQFFSIFISKSRARARVCMCVWPFSVPLVLFCLPALSLFFIFYLKTRENSNYRPVNRNSGIFLGGGGTFPSVSPAESGCQVDVFYW